MIPVSEQKNIIDLNPIFKGDAKNIDFSFEFSPECMDEDVNFKKPVSVTGKAYEKAAASRNSENLVMAEFILRGEYTALCSRCLEEVPVNFEYTAEYAVAPELQNEEESSVMLAPAGILDIGEAADALFFMNLPSKHLCKEDCKGICQGCGKSLNTEKCTCSGKNIDPRLAVLKKLLDKQEN